MAAPTLKVGTLHPKLKCAQTVVELDTASFMAVKTFSDAILSFGYSTTCFNYNEFRRNLEKVVVGDLRSLTLG
jgi:hypothetical protein